MAIINGTSGNDTLIGSNGNEVVNDTLNGFGGNDLLDGRFGYDLLDGGAGIDTADYSFYSKGIVASLQTGVVSFPGDSTLTDTLAGIENVIASSGDDSLIGNQANNTLNGETGNDTLNGGTGNDRLNGGTGNDTLNGGTGNDLLDGGLGYDLLDGGAGIDTADYSFYSGGIVASLQTGVVSFPGGSTLTDTLAGIENVIASSGDDSLIGNQANNTLNGGTGDDTLNGGTGNDNLIGGTGDDTLIGVGDNFGRGERDTLIGGIGFDRYILGGTAIGGSGSVYYNDGRANNGVTRIPAAQFGLVNRTSDTGWREYKGGSKFHFGVDYGSGGVPTSFKAGVSGTVTQPPGGENNTITVRLANGNQIQYLHASEVNPALKLASSTNPVSVTPDTILGKTGGTGPNGPNHYAVHLHVQAKNANGNYIDTDAALSTLPNQLARDWCQGINDYAVITGFNATEDIIQLEGPNSQYTLLNLSISEGIVKQGLVPSGTAIIWDNDGTVGLSKRDELIGVVAGQNLTATTNFTGFSFV